MKCTEIKAGMTLMDHDGTVLTVISLARHTMVDGKRIPLDNRRRNKWMVDFPGKGQTMCCFDQEWDNDKVYHFSQPKSA